MARVRSFRFGRGEKEQAFARSLVEALRDTLPASPDLREPLASTKTRRPPGGAPEPEGAPSLDPRGGYRIRPADQDQDPDPEDEW